MLPTYATPTDLQAAPWSITGASELVIRYAAMLVRRATQTALYDADPATGLPTDSALKDALRDAVCAQVTTWTRLSIDPAAGPADPGRTIASKSLAGGSIQYSNYASTVEARARATRMLDPNAYAILSDAGLVGEQPLVYG